MSKSIDLKSLNIHKIRACFYNGQVWTKNQLAWLTELSLASTTNILQELLNKQEICFIGERASTGGRKSKQYRLNQDYCHILKLILKRQKEHDDFICQTVNLFNQVMREQVISSIQGRVEELVTLIKNVLETDPLIRVICISIPGVCHDGFIDVCDFEQFEHVNLKQVIQTCYNGEMQFENDVNVAAMGFYRQHPNCASLAFVYQPAVHDVGCGMMIEGKLYKGFSHFAGELRYLPFYTTQEQDLMLKEQPRRLLQWQLETLCCVVNPEIIGVCSDVIEPLMDLEAIPKMHQPLIIPVNDLDAMIKDGLYQMSIEQLLEE